MLFALVSGVAAADERARVDSLYARLGGTPKVTAFVRDAIDEARVSSAEAAPARDHWVARICALSGGGCIAGDAAREASGEMIEPLRRAMRAQGVPLAARNELLDRLAAGPRDLAHR